jgi:aminoglycoside/choline kinase family phosphotransferase
MPSSESLRWAASVLDDFDPATSPAPHRLPGAGSDRILARLFRSAGSVVLAENPSSLTEGPNENDSFVYLSGHLLERGLPVPKVLAYGREAGAYLMEDLGDDDLYGKVRAGLTEGELRDLYREAVRLLSHMQIDGREGFDASRTHSPARYDRHLMLAGEAGYFRREFLENFLGLQVPDGLEGEFARLADRAGRAGADFFLHRDFQSMNLKLREGKLWIIDFQGGRLGPPQYDLAALLLDPYVELPRELRGELMSSYLEDFLRRSGLDRSRYLDDFPFVAVHRSMQALGAYAFLGATRGRERFLSFIPAGLRLLQETVRLLPATEYPFLHRVAEEAGERVEQGE